MKIDTFLKVARALSKFSLSNKVATIFHFFTPLFYSTFLLHFFTPFFHSTLSLHFFTVSAAVCHMEETSSYAFYLLGSAVCQREETRRVSAIKSVTGPEAKALSACNPRWQLSVRWKRPAAMHFICWALLSVSGKRHGVY